MSFIDTEKAHAAGILLCWKQGSILSYTVNTSTDVLTTQGARVSAAIALIKFSLNIAVPVTDGLINPDEVGGALWLRQNKCTG